MHLSLLVRKQLLVVTSLVAGVPAAVVAILYASNDRPVASYSQRDVGVVSRVRTENDQTEVRGSSRLLQRRGLLAQEWLSVLVADGNSPLTTAQALHVLREFGANVSLKKHDDTNAKLVQQLAGNSPTGDIIHPTAIVKTVFGARCLTQVSGGPVSPDREAHRDQYLATFAELGLPESFQLQTRDGDTCTVHDLLDDAIATFSMEEKELVWTATALVRYLPPNRKWTNCDDETFSFDDLVCELISRGFRNASCGGTHRLTCLCMILRQHRKAAIISARVESLLLSYLRNVAHHIEKVQNDDGSWSGNWMAAINGLGWEDGDATPGDSEDARLLVTGHMAELMLRFQGEIGISSDSLTASQQWLWTRIQDVDRSALAKQICPYFHALGAIPK